MHTHHGQQYTAVTAGSADAKDCDYKYDNSDNDETDGYRLNQWHDVYFTAAVVPINRIAQC